jgi:4a-hydroxytetrahydrobiopterin dehydratase
MDLNELLSKHCQERPAGTPPLSAEQAREYLALVPGWELVDDGKGIRMTRRCEGFLDAVATIDRVAPLAEEEDHHPDLRVYSYRWLAIDFSTHSIGGLSENDFIMAAKINRLLGQ